MCAASSITRSDRASERPASEEVEDALISDQLLRTKDERLSIAI